MTVAICDSLVTLREIWEEAPSSQWKTGENPDFAAHRTTIRYKTGVGWRRGGARILVCGAIAPTLRARSMAVGGNDPC